MLRPAAGVTDTVLDKAQVLVSAVFHVISQVKPGYTMGTIYQMKGPGTTIHTVGMQPTPSMGPSGLSIAFRFGARMHYIAVRERRSTIRFPLIAHPPTPRTNSQANRATCWSLEGPKTG